MSAARASLSAGRLPSAWLALTSGQIQSALRAFDPASSQYLPWRQLLLSLIMAAHPALVTGSSWQLCQAMQRLAAAEGDRDGCLTQQEWQAADLWFAPAAASKEQGGSAEDEAEQQQGVKALLWRLLAGWRRSAEASDELLDVWLVLQVLCMGSDATAAAARVEGLAQAAPALLRSRHSAGTAAALPAGWLQLHDVYISALNS
jgi:hypothetical protein